MSSIAWTEQDLHQINGMGLSPLILEKQLEVFKNPPTALELVRPATVGGGILQLNPLQKEWASQKYESAKKLGRFSRFIPASGAATRMFQTPLKFLNQVDFNQQTLEEKVRSGDCESLQLLDWIKQLKKMAFYPDLEAVMAQKALNLSHLLEEGNYALVLRYLLTEEGLHYAQKPKGLICFHQDKDQRRTAFQEHLKETQECFSPNSRPIRVHLTVSPEHLKDFEEYYESIARKNPEMSHMIVEFSVQELSTQTIAVNEANEPFRDSRGQIVFRPGGHGALIDNLNRLQGDLVYIRNIDNVAIPSALELIVEWKKILGGYLSGIQEQVFHFLRLLNSDPNEEDMSEVLSFCENELWMDLSTTWGSLSKNEKKEKLFKILNRPIRVCGVVPHQGDRGGGPFWVKNPDGSCSLQIVESAQVSSNRKKQLEIFQQSSHFNPVDLVCGMKTWQGHFFDLRDFMDPSAVLISEKTFNGHQIKALELPGLWNGAMADWITILVEVPGKTFNPVKSVFDLLKPEHQSI